MSLIKSGHIKENEEAEYTKLLLKNVVEAYELNEATRFGDVLIGSQNGEKYSQAKNYSYPFEATIRINSTHGRLQTFYRYEELVSITAFMK